VIAQSRYLPRFGYTPMPWRNGVGVTQEIAREPAQGEPFIWRLSLATIAVSGPFSSYPGYQRVVALVDGRGFRLRTQDAPAQILATRGEHAQFDGAAATHCELLDGACTDLSLMVREPGRIASVARLRIGGALTLPAACNMLQAVFVLHGAIECHAPESAAPGRPAADSQTLAFNDTLLIRGREDPWTLAQTSTDTAEVLVIAFAAGHGENAVAGPAAARAGTSRQP